MVIDINKFLVNEESLNVLLHLEVYRFMRLPNLTTNLTQVLLLQRNYLQHGTH